MVPAWSPGPSTTVQGAGHKLVAPTTLRAVTTYGFAIKALPKGGKPPFRDDKDDEDLQPDADAPPESSPQVEAANGETEVPADGIEEEPGQAANETPTDGSSASEEDAVAPVPAEDDARPWSGDPYDEGDESDPADAFAAYKGANGEEAWLDQAQDGTLTGWVRDAGGQVWRYNDPDVWGIDVDDAQMTRTHSQAEGGGKAPSPDRGGQDPLFPPKTQS